MASETGTSQRGHFAVLDVLRALAACAVFAHHVQQQFFGHSEETLWPRFFAHLGSWGVAVFFVLSGFCIHWSSLQQAAQGEAFSRRRYAERRFFRIYPAFVVALALSYVAGRLWPANLLPSSGPLDIALHLSLLSSFFSDHRGAVNNVVWSVVVEMHFYIVYGLLQRHFRGGHSALRMLVLGMAVAVVTYGLSVTAWPAGPTRVMVQNTFLASWWTWCLGAFVAELMARSPIHGPKPSVHRATALLAVFVVVSIAVGLVGGSAAIQARRFVLPLMCAGLLFMALRLPLRAQGGWMAPLAKVGLVSYSLYLLHPLAITLGVHVHLPLVATLALVAVAGLAMARVSYVLIERPASKLRFWGGNA